MNAGIDECILINIDSCSIPVIDINGQLVLDKEIIRYVVSPIIQSRWDRHCISGPSVKQIIGHVKILSETSHKQLIVSTLIIYFDEFMSKNVQGCESIHQP